MKEIVIIEDTKLHQKKIKDSVLDLGYRVSGVFAFGEKAIDFIFEKDIPPNLIIIDIVLKGKMNGYQVAKKINLKFNIPFIFLTVKKDEIRGFEASVYLNKPFNKNELKNNIELALYKNDIYQKMIKNNELKKMILDTTDTQIWYLKDPETYGKINQARANFIGLEKPEIENKKINSFLNNKEAEICSLKNKIIFRENKTIQTEEWLENNKGEKRLLSITKNPKLNKSGQVEFVVCSAKDITENKRRENIIKDLHQIALAFKVLGSEKEICEMVVKAAGNLLELNLCNILLVKEEEFVPVAFFGNFEQEKRPISDNSIAAKTYKEGKSFIIDDLQNNTEALSVKEIYKSAISIPIGNYGVFQAAAPRKNHFTKNDLEITEILISHAIASLEKIYFNQKEKEQKRFLNTILNTIPEIIILLDKEGYYLDILTSESEDLVDKKDNLIGKNVRNVLPINVANKYLKYCNIVYQGRKIKSFDYMLSNNNKKKYFNVIFSPVNYSSKKDNLIVATIRNITDLKESEKHLEYLSFHDEMTGLFSRRYFENELKCLESSRKLPITIVIGDLDGLKYVNDNYGHKMGDEYIIKVAEILKSTARSEDIIARIGGDEFAIILSDTNCSQAEKLCHRIQNNITKFNKEQKPVKPLSISLGFEVMKDSSQGLSKIFNKADQKMYINKGRK